MNKKFRVYEGNKIIQETNIKQVALLKMVDAHRHDPSKYHEVHEFNVLGDNLYHGTNQLEPYDCPNCFRNPRDCKCEEKVKVPEGWMTHAEWSNNQTLESYNKTENQKVRSRES